MDVPIIHSGDARNICTICGVVIAADKASRRCDRCLGFYHADCWDQRPGCLRCEQRAGRTAGDGDWNSPVIVTAAEARAAQSPPPLCEAIPSAPGGGMRATIFAVPAAVATALSLVLLVGLKEVPQAAQLGGWVAALAGVAFAICAAPAAAGNRKVVALSIVCIAVSCAAVIYATLGTDLNASRSPSALTLEEMRRAAPTEEQLRRLPAAVSDALRANVVVVADGVLTQTSGSGVVTRVADGAAYILTNRHVAGIGAVTVVFQDGHIGIGKVTWLAPDGIDLAFVECDVPPAQTYGSVGVYSGTVSAGTKTFAIGNPISLPWTYTSGVVSSTRKIEEGSVAIDVYQIQVPVNPGNSGGGLYSESGELIGINTWKQGGALSEGIAFSISTRALLDLLNDDEVNRFIGKTTAVTGLATQDDSAT